MYAHEGENYDWVHSSEGYEVCSICGAISPESLLRFIEDKKIKTVELTPTEGGWPDDIKFYLPFETIATLPLMHLFDMDNHQFDVIAEFLDRPGGVKFTRNEEENKVTWAWVEDGSN